MEDLNHVRSWLYEYPGKDWEDVVISASPKTKRVFFSLHSRNLHSNPTTIEISKNAFLPLLFDNEWTDLSVVGMIREELAVRLGIGHTAPIAITAGIKALLAAIDREVDRQVEKAGKNNAG